MNLVNGNPSKIVQYARIIQTEWKAMMNIPALSVENEWKAMMNIPALSVENE
jgi:hypothetical protein